MRSWITVLALLTTAAAAGAQTPDQTFPSPRFTGGKIVKSGNGGMEGTLWKEFDATGTLRGTLTEFNAHPPYTTNLTVFDDKGREVYSESRRVDKDKTEVRSKSRTFDGKGRVAEDIDLHRVDYGVDGRRDVVDGTRVVYDYSNDVTGLGRKTTTRILDGYVDPSGKPVHFSPSNVDKGLQYAPYAPGGAAATPAKPTSAMRTAEQPGKYAWVRQLAAGLAVPKGQLGEEASPGWQVMAAIKAQLIFVQKSLAARARAEHARFPNAEAMPDSFSASQTTLNIDGIMSFGDDRLVPYAVAGAGMARNVVNFGESSISSWKPGFTLGAGLDYRLGGRTAVGAELRYQKHDTFGALSVNAVFSF